MTGIDPNVLKAIAALVIVGLLVEAISQASSGAAWVLVVILALGALLFTPEVTGTLANFGASLSQGLK